MASNRVRYTASQRAVLAAEADVQAKAYRTWQTTTRPTGTCQCGAVARFWKKPGDDCCPSCTCIPLKAGAQLKAIDMAMAAAVDRAREIRRCREAFRGDYFKSVGAGLDHAWFRTFAPATESQRRALAVVQEYRGSPWSLLLSGDTGCGKTHLAAAAWRAWERRGKVCTWIEERDAAAAWRACFGGRISAADEYVESLASAPVLFIDDLGVISQTAAGWLAAMSAVLCAREARRLPTICTTNLTGQQVAAMYGERIASRLGGGLTLRIDGPDGRRPKQL